MSKSPYGVEVSEAGGAVGEAREGLAAAEVGAVRRVLVRRAERLTVKR